MTSRISTILIAVFILLLTSCSTKPSASDVETSLSERITSESNGNLSLIEFEQTNAVEQEVFGQARYTVQFKGKVHIENDCFMYVNKSGMGSFFESFKTYESAPEFIPSMMMTGVQCIKGNDVAFNDVVTYLETEEGWVKVKEPKLY